MPYLCKFFYPFYCDTSVYNDRSNHLINSHTKKSNFWVLFFIFLLKLSSSILLCHFFFGQIFTHDQYKYSFQCIIKTTIHFNAPYVLVYFIYNLIYLILLYFALPYFTLLCLALPAFTLPYFA